MPFKRTFPADVMLCIIDFATPDMLVDLALLSRLYYRHVARRLYRDVFVRWPHRFHLFLRAILTNIQKRDLALSTVLCPIGDFIINFHVDCDESRMDYRSNSVDRLAFLMPLLNNLSMLTITLARWDSARLELLAHDVGPCAPQSLKHLRIVVWTISLTCSVVPIVC